MSVWAEKKNLVICPAPLFGDSASQSALDLFHPVEGGASLEPLDLRLVKGVVQLDVLRAAV